MSGGIPRKGEPIWPYQPPPPEPADENTINLALFPYVPNPKAFEAVVQALWNETKSPIKLQWANYNCYREEPPDTLDVYAFDCAYADDLMANGKLDPIAAAEIAGLDDLMPFARANAAIDEHEQRFAGIPYLGCTSVIFYRKGDAALENLNPVTVAQLLAVMGKADYSTAKPPANKGLMIDLSSKTVDALDYAAAFRYCRNQWWPTPMPMPLPPQIEAEALQGLVGYREMAGVAQATYKDPGTDRVRWLEEGCGRALNGYPEAMGSMRPDALPGLRLRPMPVSPAQQRDELVCYADAVGLRPGMSEQKKAAALELANLIASAKVFVSSVVGATCQYLTPTRASVLQALAKDPAVGPKYTEIASMLQGGSYKPVPFRLGNGVRPWAPAMGEAIISKLFPGIEEEVMERPSVAFGYETTPAGIRRKGD